MDMVLYQKVFGEDVVWGWLLVIYVFRLCKGRKFQDVDVYGKILEKVYDEIERCFLVFIFGLKDYGWYFYFFLEGFGV